MRVNEESLNTNAKIERYARVSALVRRHVVRAHAAVERGNLTVADVERRVVGGAFVRLDPERRARELRVRERQPNKVELPSLVAVLAYSSKGKLATHLKQLPGSGEISPSWSPHRPLARPRLQPQRRRVLVVEGRRAFCARRTTPPPLFPPADADSSEAAAAVAASAASRRSLRYGVWTLS